jgi:DNA-binding IclR family transcriptional regulator
MAGGWARLLRTQPGQRLSSQRDQTVPTRVPAVDRSVLILNLLASRPYDELSLSEIARETEIHKATCAAILISLSSSGLVTRTDARKYRLGGRLVSLNAAYLQRYRTYVEGRRDMVRLADELDLSCSATVVDGDDMVVLDIIGDTEPSHVRHRIGARIPLLPPVGTVFRAWGSAEDMLSWLDTMDNHYGGDRNTHLAAISEIRSRGYSIGGELDLHIELDAALKSISDQEVDSGSKQLAVAMIVADRLRNATPDPNGKAINYVAAPVFGPEKEVAMSVNLFGRPGQIRYADIDRIASRLLATTESIRRKTGGVLPTALDLLG